MNKLSKTAKQFEQESKASAGTHLAKWDAEAGSSGVRSDGDERALDRSCREDMNKRNKREVSTLIPYYKKGQTIFIYLQKRDKGAKRLAGYFGFFGGGLEKGETPEEGMLREIWEELTIKPKKYGFFSRYEFLKSINNVYIIKVEKNFDKLVKINEGEYGKFFQIDKVNKIRKIAEHDRLVIHQLEKYLKNANEK